MDDLNPAGRYALSNGSETYELVIDDDGAFKVSDVLGSGSYLTGTIGKAPLTATT